MLPLGRGDNATLEMPDRRVIYGSLSQSPCTYVYSIKVSLVSEMSFTGPKQVGGKRKKKKDKKKREEKKKRKRGERTAEDFAEAKYANSDKNQTGTLGLSACPSA